MKTKKSLLKFLLIVTGILVLVNFLSDSYFFRLDFTSDKRYTLSNATKDILQSLKQPVTIKAYFSDNLPPDIAKTKRDFKDLLIEYSNRSKGKVVYNFINPNEKEELETEAAQSGVQPVMINVREKDQLKQQKAYLGAVLQMGEKTDAIPFMQPGAAMEYALSSSIKKLSVGDKPTIGILQGHGEASLQSMMQVQNSLSVLYNVEPVNVSDTDPIPDNIHTLAIIDPKDTFPENHIRRIDEFVSKGKNIFIAYNKQSTDLSQATGTPRFTGIESWLSDKGIQIEDQFVVDATCGSVSVRQQQGQFTFNTQMQFPFFPLINKFEEHPVTKGLEQVILRFPSPIKFTGDTSMHFTPIIKSSSKAGIQPSPAFFNIQKQWVESDFPSGDITIGASLGGKSGSKMIVIANGDFAVNGEGQMAQQLPPDNVNLLVNSIDWLSDATGLIDLRTKGVSSRPLDAIEDGSKTFYKYLNFLLPLILIVVYGLVRAQRKRITRIKRIEESYV